MITPAQSRAARGLLEWSQSDLARHANLSESTIRDFEKGRRVPSENNLRAVIDAFKAAGVEVHEPMGSRGEGVAFERDRLRQRLDRLHRDLASMEHLERLTREELTVFPDDEENKRFHAYAKKKIAKLELDVAGALKEISERDDARQALFGSSSAQETSDQSDRLPSKHAFEISILAQILQALDNAPPGSNPMHYAATMLRDVSNGVEIAKGLARSTRDETLRNARLLLAREIQRRAEKWDLVG